MLQETTAEVASFTTRKNQDWFDENDVDIQELLQRKRSCHSRLLRTPVDQTAKVVYWEACCKLQVKLRAMQNNWWSELAEKIQWCADVGDLRSLYKALRAV